MGTTSTGSLNEKHIDNGREEAECSRCGEKVTAPSFSCVECGFYLRNKCAEAPLEIRHPFHGDHPLVLLQTSPYASGLCIICDFCGKECERFVYHCPCGLDFHIKRALLTYNVAVKSFEELENAAHEDPLVFAENDIDEEYGDINKCFGCWEPLANYTYFFLDCGFNLHKKCAELPLKINHMFHRKPPLILQFNSKRLSCKICQETQEGDLFIAVYLAKNEDELFDSLAVLSDDINSITSIIERNDVGEATKIKHFKHCDFLFRKAYAELPKMKHVWHHRCQQPLILISDDIFRCETCNYISNGFAYKCNECEDYICLQCITINPAALTCQGHEHPLFLYHEYKEQCSTCGDEMDRAFRCKNCNFALNCVCIRLPTTAQHKCDEHLLELTYDDDNTYSECNYCDICEERRDPNLWFYHCSTCDTSAHVNCVLGEYPFIKLGSIYKKGIIHTLSLLSKKFITTLNALNVVNHVKVWPLNVQNLDATILSIGNV
ncbi:hypothetical protein PTKIN_Ptkin17bG0036600 [Pterospermum kingtungense]